MRLLTVPNWSFGRDQRLLGQFGEGLESRPLAVHYLASDVDHNRTVAAFSGAADEVFSALIELARLAFDSIDLNRHMGVHPRVGALDVCPFVPLDGPSPDALDAVARFAERLAREFELPVYLYEKSERGRHESDLPSLRRGGFGGLADRELHPDFGPKAAHPRLGVSVVGVREPLIAMNVDLREANPLVARGLARQIRTLRSEGDSRFLGVRALGFPLASRGESQVSLNITLPDLTPVDPIVAWIRTSAEAAGVAVARTELIGVIRERDVATASRLPIDPAQIVG